MLLDLYFHHTRQTTPRYRESAPRIQSDDGIKQRLIRWIETKVKRRKPIFVVPESLKKAIAPVVVNNLVEQANRTISREIGYDDEEEILELFLL